MAMSAQDKLFKMSEKAESDDKVLDVSKITVDGKGARVIQAPRSDRSSKMQISDLNIVSDNYESYKLAMSILGPEYNVYSAAYLRNFGNLEPRVRSPRTRSPMRSQSPPRTRSPARSQSPSRNNVVRARSLRSQSPQRFDIRSNVRNY